ncbi:hypothetical protein [Flavobacterium caeni]|uniref:Uncharacterized protein n=1 Tax=Flavobacterium caeni TaxID=490189 RepID=A0A1G5JEG8_9FLAO|nr:hypothetical protein [Flavobacterium caeni]SCY86209.1 hypothetical protein SAMN02927903_02657 [Flavobacterium caeni]
MKNLILGAMLLVGVCATAQEDKKAKTEAATTEATKETSQTAVKADNGTTKAATKTETTTTTVPATEADKKKKADASAK